MKIGDIVKLNSGSPALTVTEIKGKIIIVEWGEGRSKSKMTAPAVCFTLESAPTERDS